jgi:hypothetical protein
VEELKKRVEELVKEELERANNENKPVFSSLHEGYAVMLEEFQECEQELDQIRRHLNFLWHYVKQDNEVTVLELAELINKKTILAACEAVQTAAMAVKLIESFKIGGKSNE